MGKQPSHDISAASVVVALNCTEDLVPWLADFSRTYHRCHAYLSLLLCVLGICMNSFNVIVLMQSHMRNSSNLLLSMIAVSDSLVMSIYIVYDTNFRISPRLENGMPQRLAYVLLICIVAQNVFHTFSTWTIVVLAAYRLVYVHAGARARRVCSRPRIRLLMVLVAFMSLLLTVPLLIAHRVTFHHQYRSVWANRNSSSGVDNATSANTSEELYEVDYVDNPVLQTILFFNSALLVKAIPILLMASMSALLIRKIRSTRRCRQRVKQNDSMRSSVVTMSGPQNDGGLPLLFFKSCRGYDICHHITQPTRMLLAVVVMYIVAYLPQASFPL
ncbi:G-protein coupled receptor activity [Sparganum proliferum]